MADALNPDTGKTMSLPGSSPDEAYLRAAIEDGRATIRHVSMSALGRPDTRYQARAIALDPGHVERLSFIYEQQGSIAPIVVFRAGPRMIMADGFHRHAMISRKGLATIAAYVIDVGPSDLEHEARLFAATTNQFTLLGRTHQDMRKAVEMMFSDPICWN